MRIVLIILLAASLALGGCGQAEGGSDERLQVVATTSILGDVVGSVVRGDADVSVLIPPGADPHDFQISARQAASLADADLVVANGLGLEAGATELLGEADRRGRLLELAPQLDPEPVAGNHDDGGALDPHVWLDPVRMAEAARLIGAALAEIDTTVEWEDRAGTYARELEAMHEEIEALVATIPESRRVVLTNHDVLAYFARRYDFDVVGVIIRGGGTGGEPSARDLERLARQIEREGVPAIFAEATQPRRLAEALRREVGVDVKVVELHTESLGKAGSGAETYIEMMRTNARRIVDGLAA